MDFMLAGTRCEGDIVRRTWAKHAIIRPLSERFLGIEWYPASFICANVRVCRHADGRVLCKPRSVTRVAAARWRLIGFRLLYAWRHGRAWREPHASV